jgi:Phage portal protein, SPP1 Gp6-like
MSAAVGIEPGSASKLAETMSRSGAYGSGDKYRTKADEERLKQMNEAWQAYRGELPKALKPAALGQTDDNVRTNRCAPITDTFTSYLTAEVLGVEVAKDDDDAPAPAPVPPRPGKPGKPGKKRKGKIVSPQQKALDACWGDDDDKMTLLAKLHLTGSVCGHHFLKILTPDETGIAACRFVVLDPLHVTMQTRPDDCETVISYCIEYRGLQDDEGGTYATRQIITRKDPDNRASYGYEDTDSSWTIANFKRIGASTAWLTDDDAPGGAQFDWQHSWPPIIDNQNMPNPNDHWGTPDLTPDLIEQNKTLNFVLSNAARTIRLHAHPWIWTDAEASVFNTSIGNVIQLPPGSTLNAVTASGDLTNMRASAADIRSDMDEQSHVPGVATGRMEAIPRGNVSGVTIKTLHSPALSKNTQKQRLYGKSVREASTRALALCGFGDGTDANGVRVTLRWQNPLPSDDLAEAQTWQLKTQFGYSDRTAITATGGDPDEEIENKMEEGQNTVNGMVQGKVLPAPPQLSPKPAPPQQQPGPMAQPPE